MQRTLNEARDLIKRKVAEHGGEMTGVAFILCEDARTVMIFCDVDDEHDAVAIYFDLADGEVFDRERHAAEFFRPVLH